MLCTKRNILDETGLVVAPTGINGTWWTYKKKNMISTTEKITCVLSDPYENKKEENQTRAQRAGDAEIITTRISS